ncbi:twin-arginine translocation signal domain-containing protein, partial [Burkholderia sp. SIMBA_019]|uniref:twin-arginine translocation signal domain-containing protein n=1 Tax=Burkholderia sp. SIMBA_019 TaxID=3085765 RepID=UPI00397D1536
MASRLAAGLAGAMPTMDRRSFLKRSGIGVGAGLAATQLTLSRKADADDGKAGAGAGKGEIVVRRTVCGHCSVGCAV